MINMPNIGERIIFGIRIGTMYTIYVKTQENFKSINTKRNMIYKQGDHI